MSDVTLLLQAIRTGDCNAYDALLSLVYGELRRIAGSLMRSERAGHTLQPTALVHEVYLRLLDSSPTWENRAHFFGAAATAMRRILVEHARQRLAQKRGAGARRVTFEDLDVQAEDPNLNLLALDESLRALGDVDARLVQIVELRYFAGFSIEETAATLGISTAKVKRDWNYARAWLYEHMSR